jgi:iron complex outermembrane receptor protein
VGTQLGSFSNIRKQASVTYGGAQCFTAIKWFAQDAQNNFTYTNTFLPDKPQATLSNAQVKQTGFMIEQYGKLSANQELNVNLWYQYADRNIPPTMSVPQQKAFQQDEAFRTTAEWKLKRLTREWMLRSAYFDERIYFQDPGNTQLNGNNHSKTSVTEAEFRAPLGNHHLLNVGVNNTYTIAYSTGYEGWKDINRTSVFVSYKTLELIRKVTTTLSVRQEKVAAEWAPVMPSLGMEWRVINGCKLMGNVSRSYRVPTLNERYWITGVSTTLQPETGWSEEISLVLTPSIKKIQPGITLTTFNRNLQNWIVWQPVGANWAPQNIKSVWSRGLEGRFTVSIPVQKLVLNYSGNINWVLSTNNQTALSGDASIDKQLLYVPRVTQQHQLTATYGQSFVAYSHQYTGIRFITTDNSQWLNDYQLASVSVGTRFYYKQLQLVWSAQIQNLYNKSYQAIADRPMPGRHFFITLTLTL